MAFSGTILNVPAGANLEPYFAQMTNGASVKLQLERGGTWTGDYLYRQAGGTADAPHIITAKPGTGALPILTGQLQCGVEATPITGLTVKSLEFRGPGPKIASSGSHLKLTGLVLSGCSQGIIVNVDGDGTTLRWNNVKINKNRVLDLSNTSGQHGNGLYCYGCDNLRIVDNVFDNAVAPKDIFSHHLYIQNGNTGLVVDRNILCRSSSHALQLRPGGEASFNLILDCPIGILGGGGTSPEVDGVHLNLHDNVVIGGGNIDPDSQFPDGQNAARGWAYYLENVASGVVANNIAANALGGDPRGLTKDCSANNGFGDEVGVLYTTGINYHQGHGTVHTDAGASTGTTVSLTTAPITGADLSLTNLGISYTMIRAGQVQAAAIVQLVKQFMGLATPPKTEFWDAYLKRVGARVG